jgi:hypothetical protein
MEMGWLRNLLVRRPVAHFDRRLARFWTTPHPDPPRRKRGEGEELRPLAEACERLKGGIEAFSSAPVISAACVGESLPDV